MQSGNWIRIKGVNDRCYNVPTSCPDKRYSAPCGLGPTMVANSVVLTYPDVNQYLIEPAQREPHVSQIGFLCACSSSSSAALKGLVRYTCTGTVCRCYNMGVDEVLSNMCDKLTKRNHCRSVIKLGGYTIMIQLNKRVV